MNLSLITDEQLWNELSKRNTAAIMVTLKKYDSDREAVHVFYSGGKFTCLGLAEHCHNKIADAMADNDDDILGDV